jgi:tetratricopeptide (TPR) repeat protein
MAQEQANLRAALRWLIDDGQAGAALRLVAPLADFWRSRGGIREGRERLAEALALPGPFGDPLARVSALQWAAFLAYGYADFPTMSACQSERLAICREIGDRAGIVNALAWLSFGSHQQGQYESPRPLIDEALTIARQLDDQSELAEVLGHLADRAIDRGEFVAARQYLAEGYHLASTLRLNRLALWARYNLGRLALFEGDDATAELLFAEDLAAAEQLGYVDHTGICDLFGLGHLACRRGNFALARSLIDRGLRIGVEFESYISIQYGVDHFAILAAANGQLSRAARLAGAGTTMRVTHRMPCHPSWRSALLREGVPVERPPNDPTTAEAWDDGLTMTREQAIAYAREVEENRCPRTTVLTAAVMTGSSLVLAHVLDAIETLHPLTGRALVRLAVAAIRWAGANRQFVM